MRDWRKKSSPPCPICGRGHHHIKHKNCRLNGMLWLDLYSGTILCDGCGDYFLMENTITYCSCGAKYSGGEVWYGMGAEWVEYAHLEWLQQVEITAGDWQTKFLGWWKKKEPAQSAQNNNSNILIRSSKYQNFQDDSNCFVATYVYGSKHANQVELFRKLRDSIFIRYSLGRLFIYLYYNFLGPFIISNLGKIGKSAKMLAVLSRIILDILYAVSKKIYKDKENY